MYKVLFVAPHAQERKELKERRQAQTVAWMSNFTGMFGGATTATIITAAPSATASGSAESGLVGGGGVPRAR